MPTTPKPHPLFLAAAVPGVLHGVASLYWATGGTFLADTVGQWALDMYRADPVAVGAMLAVIGVAKLIAAAVPIANDAGRLPAPRVWRGLTWAGAVGIILWGLQGMVGGLLQLAGVWPLTDRMGAIGHAFLWDPLFALWGGLLVGALVRTRKR